MNNKILSRLITLITLTVDLRGEKFLDTVELACAFELETLGIPRDLVFAVAPHVAKSIVGAMEKDRASLADAFQGLKVTPDCTCAGCRVAKWAKGQAPREGTREEKAEAKELIDKLLASVKHQN